MMAEIGVVHLVRATNGIEPFARFLASYERSNLADPERELLILYKGFENQEPGKAGLEAYEQLLASCPHRSLSVPDIGFDIEPYFAAARAFEHPYLCFLNSFSVILDEDWLLKLYRNLRRDGVGVVGATASCLSNRHYHDYIDLGSTYDGPLGQLRLRIVRAMYRRWFDPFPNYFIRTNAFLISREVMLKIRCRPIRRKAAAYRFESGTDGLTKQVMRMGLRPLIVGRDGVGYEKEDWYATETFMQGDQRNLLVADNQTSYYQNGDAALRLKISRNSWGPKAMPVPTQGDMPDALSVAGSR
jgi:hypothetical protein